MTLKTTTYSREIRPYEVDASSTLAAMRYRHDEHDPWQDVLTGGVLVVLLNDLRREAVHQLQVEIDGARLNELLGTEGSSVRFVVLTRDAATRRVLLLANHAVSDLPEIITLDPEALRESSLEAQIKFEARLVLPTHRPARVGQPHRKGTWLAQAVWTVSKDVQGPGFNWQRKTGAEFLAAKLPSDTCWWVKLEDADAMFESTDDPADQVEIWVHEDVWPTLQELGKTPAGDAVGKILIGAVTSTLLQHAARAKTKAKIDPTSIVARLVGWIAERTESQPGELIEIVRADRAHDLEPFVQSALGLGKTLKSNDFRRS